MACAGDDTVKILKNAAGVLSLGGTFAAGPYPVSVAAADLNRDGRIDLAVADREAPQVTVLLNDGTGQFAGKDVPLVPAGYGAFEPPTDVQVDGRWSLQCAGKWLNNDGAGNFTVSGSTTWGNATYSRIWLPGDAKTVYQGAAYRTTDSYNTSTVRVTSYSGVPMPKTGDITGDGWVDVVDLLTLADSWDKVRGETGFDPYCDLNKDGSVDLLDLLVLAENWGK